MRTVIDFLLLPEDSNDVHALRRSDLAILRFHLKSPKGIEVLNDAGRRLIDYGLLLRVAGRTYVTGHGLETARANASCRDGFEGKLPPLFDGRREPKVIDVTGRAGTLRLDGSIEWSRAATTFPLPQEWRP